MTFTTPFLDQGYNTVSVNRKPRGLTSTEKPVDSLAFGMERPTPIKDAAPSPCKVYYPTDPLPGCSQRSR